MPWECSYFPPQAFLVSTFFCTYLDVAGGKKQMQSQDLSPLVTWGHCAPRWIVFSSFLVLGAAILLADDAATELC